MSIRALRLVTFAALAFNAMLAALKLWGYARSGSVALLSDGMNSLLDVAATTAVLVSVQVGRSAPDREHPFGHARAEPIAGFVIAIIACILGIEVLQSAVVRFLTGKTPEINDWVFGILIASIVTKLA